MGKHTQALIYAIGAVELLSEVMTEENSEYTHSSLLVEKDGGSDNTHFDSKLKKFVPLMIPKDKTLVITVGIAYCNLGVQ